MGHFTEFFGPLEKLREMPHYMFCPRQKIISRTFKIRGTLVFFMSRRERESESESESKSESGSESKSESESGKGRESERDRVGDRKGTGKGKERERKYESAGDFISKRPGPE